MPFYHAVVRLSVVEETVMIAQRCSEEEGDERVEYRARVTCAKAISDTFKH